ncbi:MAG: hypothetical protein BGO76_07210 [Caedibacter sp. 38-128]|nr:hypothetical protein [Holosporales bacterium]OJX04798.1 MAG: hypothetical protein BGO76_07210 [Caedibacter sp. 38-128]
MFHVLTSTLFATSLLFSFAAQAATSETKSETPETLSKPYGCPPSKNIAQCKKEAEDEFINCMKLIDQEEQDVEDTLGDKAPTHPTQRACEDEREKHMNECEKNCK